jgi:hypothetical protein
VDTDAVLALLAGLLVEDAAPDAGDLFWSGMIDAMLRLHPIAHLDAIRRAFDEGLVPSGIMDFAYVEDRLAEGPQEDAPEDDIAEDVHDWIGWWACFHEPPKVEAKPRREVPALSDLPSRPQGKLARNGPCWCGSGRKYKGCHLASDEDRRSLPKLSTILTKIAAPMIELAGDDRSKIQVAVNLAAAAWNVSRGAPRPEDDLLIEELGASGAEAWKAVLPVLVEVAKQWPDDPRIVAKVEVVGRPGNYVVNATSLVRD